MSKSSFDALMENRRLDKKISKEKLKVKESEQKIFSLQNSINNIKQKILKVLTILKEAEQKFENTCNELRNFHKLYDDLIEYIHENTIIPNYKEPEKNNINALREKKHNLQNALLKVQAEKKELVLKTNNVDLEITIQKEKNAATLLYLQKNLEELLQEEKNLLDKL